MRRTSRIAPAALAVGALLLLGGCAPKDNPELQFARAALERNPQVKVLETDTANNLIKVRIVATGETISVTPGELAAIPIGDLVTLARQAQTATMTPAPTPSVEPVPTPVPEPRPTISTAPEPSPPVTQPTYSVQREDGRVRVSGPGVSIETAAKPAAATETVPVRSDDPVICDGKMLLHLDGRTINAAEDAVIARGGCELYITNSRISASGTALTVLDAIVHVANSELQGDGGSLTVSSAARVYLRNSKFVGISRRDPSAAIQDQGGNTWR